MSRLACMLFATLPFAISACGPATAPDASTGSKARSEAPAAPPGESAEAAQASAASRAALPSVALPDPALPLVVVHKSESCGCCTLWVEHMQKAGFRVEVRNTEDLAAIKEKLGVPAGKASCHTAEVGGYFVEGHVPADDVKRLLASKAPAKGLAVPGMPLGAPGMEAPDGRTQPYAVELVGRDGNSTEFARHGD